jgi:hypothetical protein
MWAMLGFVISLALGALWLLGRGFQFWRSGDKESAVARWGVACLTIATGIGLLTFQPEQILTNQQLAEKREQDRLQDIACRAISFCRKYASVRQECATAGDFDNCI